MEVMTLQGQVESLGTKESWMQQELDISHSKIKELEKRKSVCGQGDLQERIRELEKQSARELPPDMEELKHELEDAQEQLSIIVEDKKMYQMQVDRVLVLAGSGGHGATSGCSRKNGGENLRFSGTERMVLRGWEVHLPLKIANDPGRSFDEQLKMRYVVNRSVGAALSQIQPYIDRGNCHVMLTNLETLIQIL
jgi:hypothetical protein